MTKLANKKPRSLNLEDHLLKIFEPENYKIDITDDEIEITDKIHQANKLVINHNEIKEEFSAIRHYGKYFTIGEDFITFILSDNQNVYTGSQIKLTQPFEGKIEKRSASLGLLLLNLKDVIDFEKLKQDKPVILEEVIKENIFVCEIKVKSDFFDLTRSNISEVEMKVDQIINSLLSQIAFKFNLLLHNPRNLLSKSNNQILEIQDEDTLSFKFIQDYEPLLYFLSAEEMEYPHLKYLEYYHVLEYYFLHKKVKLMDDLISKLISTKLTSGENLNKTSYYNDLNQLVKYQFNNEFDKEISQLKEVMIKDLGFNHLKVNLENTTQNFKFLKDEIFGMSETIINSYSKIFTNANNQFKSRIKVEDGIEFCEDLAIRIYKIRNHIVHTKKFENKNVFVPSKENFDNLEKDLVLIRLISYLLITTYDN